jgi:uncharacterized protein YybS (DUF2232 family)
MPMPAFGKYLLILGLVLTFLGILISTGFGKHWLGRLPGDIRYAKGGITFYFPVVTCLLISVVVSLVLWLFRSRS